MAFDIFKRFSGLSKLRDSVGSGVGSVSGTLGIKHGLTAAIGVDFGVASLKILQVSPGEPPALIAAASLETPDNLIKDHAARLDFQLKALPRLTRQGGFKGRRVVCAIPAWQTMCKVLQFPRTDGLPIASLVDGAISSQLNCDPATLVYRHIEVSGGGGGKTEVILVAVARDLVERLMRGVQAARLEPVGMHSEFAATLRAFEYVNRRAGDDEKSTLYLDVGASTTKVMIAHGTQVVFARVIEIGGMHLDETVARQLRCDLAEARVRRLILDEKLIAPVAREAPVSVALGGGGVAAAPERRGNKLAPGFAPEVTAQESVPVAPRDADLRESLEMMTDEVMMCLRYHAGQFPGRKVDRAVFVGGEAMHRGLCQHIARAVRLPAQMADPMARVGRTGAEPCVGVDFKRAQPGWAVPLGLCLSPTDL